MPTPVYQDDSRTPTPLQIHHDQCAFSAGMIHRLRRAIEAIRSFVGSHLVSTLCLASVVTNVLVSMHSGPR